MRNKPMMADYGLAMSYAAAGVFIDASDLFDSGRVRRDYRRIYEPDHDAHVRAWGREQHRLNRERKLALQRLADAPTIANAETKRARRRERNLRHRP